MQYTFYIEQPTSQTWRSIEQSADSTIFHTEKWCRYLKRIGYKTIVIRIEEDETTIGYFIGEKLGIGGLSIVSAPFNGIGTYTQGLVMMPCVAEKKRIEIYKELANWIFDTHIALMLQVDDWQLRRNSKDWIPYEAFHHDVLEKYNIPYKVRPTLCVPVNTDEATLWSGLHYKSAKYSINKARRNGLYVREITNKAEIESFTKYHYLQLTEVCAKQGMRPKPSQRQKRMQVLCEELFPDRVIMLECRGKDENGEEQVMSTGIFCIDKGESVYWNGASFQRYQKYCPNELMVWEAMCLANKRGAGILNFGGMAAYKLKFGTSYEYIPRMSFTKFEWICRLKDISQVIYFEIRNRIALIVGKRSYK